MLRLSIECRICELNIGIEMKKKKTKSTLNLMIFLRCILTFAANRKHPIILDWSVYGSKPLFSLQAFWLHSIIIQRKSQKLTKITLFRHLFWYATHKYNIMVGRYCWFYFFSILCYDYLTSFIILHTKPHNIHFFFLSIFPYNT